MLRIINFRLDQRMREILENNMRRRGHTTISRYLRELIIKDSASHDVVISKLNEIIEMLKKP